FECACTAGVERAGGLAEHTGVVHCAGAGMVRRSYAATQPARQESANSFGCPRCRPAGGGKRNPENTIVLDTGPHCVATSLWLDGGASGGGELVPYYAPGPAAYAV